MGIFRRIADIFRSNINDALDKAEDPEKMIKLMVVEMQEALTKATSSLAQAMGNEKRLERQYQQLLASSEDMQNKALVALKASNEPLAKQALTRKSQLDQQVVQYKQMHESASATTAQLRSQVDKLKAKLDEARMKESTLIARSQNAKAQKQLAQNLGGVDDSAFGKFDRFEEKVLKAEAEAQAFTELAASNTNLDDQFAQLQKDNQVDEELARLKAMLNQ
jgi:phage shock protein A